MKNFILSCLGIVIGGCLLFILQPILTKNKFNIPYIEVSGKDCDYILPEGYALVKSSIDSMYGIQISYGDFGYRFKWYLNLKEINGGYMIVPSSEPLKNTDSCFAKALAHKDYSQRFEFKK